MKFKIGDQVKYDSGEWRFYGTISAVVENSISPCYRVVVERMEKVKCGFSTMQFEFELETDGRQTSSNRTDENTKTAVVQFPVTPVQLPVTPEPSKTVMEKAVKDAGTRSAISKTWIRNLEAYRSGEKTSLTRSWARDNILNYKSGKLKKEKLEKLQEINFSFDPVRSKAQPQVQTEEAQTEAIESASAATSSWEVNLQEYISGLRTGKIEDWAYRTRNRYRKGTLPQAQIDKLEQINFDFNPTGKSTDGTGTPITSIWERNRQAYISGERAGKVDDWARRNRRNYEKGKLSNEKLEKLIEINFPFGDATPTPKSESSTPDPDPEPTSAWDRNMRDYLKGERTSLVNMWIFHNRKQYKAGKLSEEKFDKLLKIDFPFESRPKK